MSCVYGTYKACNKIVCPVHFTGKLVAQLEQELKRLQRRKTLDSSTVGVAAAGSREQPLFTLRQVRVYVIIIGNAIKICTCCTVTRFYGDGVCIL